MGQSSTRARSARSVNRRTVVKAAWAAPAITTIAAAPAFAAYTPALLIGSFNALTSSYGGQESVGITVTAGSISLSSGTGSVSTMTMTAFVPAYQNSTNQWWYPRFGSVGTGWTQSGNGVQTTNGTRGTTYTFTSTTGLAAGATYAYPMTFQVYYREGNTWGQISTANSRVVNATLSAAGVASVTVSATVAASAGTSSATGRSGRSGRSETAVLV